MAFIPAGTDKGVLKILELLGIPIKNLRTVTINIEPNDIVIANCSYFISVEDCDKLHTELRKYRFERMEEEEKE